MVAGFPPRQVRLLVRITEIVEDLPGLPTMIAQARNIVRASFR